MASHRFDCNRLADAASPYLRQHAANPVHWQCWDDATLTAARETDTPILLSIGYSACHWCHVMAHESFENAEIAAAMNASFACIKLDREQRPDIDRVYQLAHQAFSGRAGGWPLTVFLDPEDLSPFFIGTYFPSAPRHGLPGFAQVLEGTRRHFDTERGALRQQADKLAEWMRHFQEHTPGAIPGWEDVQRKALERAAARFDARRGGDRGAPKFPRAAELEWLLDAREMHANAGDMAELTLKTMAARGLQDHLGGGFFRYCVDADWTIPHFEKMLYDNVQLLPAYARLAAAGEGDVSSQGTARAGATGIVDWLAHDMQAPGGGFYASLDADSDGTEGAFYLWTPAQARAVLSEPLWQVAEAAFGLDQPANFHGDAWHLLRERSLAGVAERLGRPVGDVTRACTLARRQLLESREARTRPARDDKVLTGWNGLAIAALSRSARLLDDARCADLAGQALAMLRETAWIDGTLQASAAAADAGIPGFLDDHAFVLEALLETMQGNFEPADLAWATALADAIEEKFVDESGGFRFSAVEHATPLARPCGWTDDSLPNGGALAIRSLLRLGHLLGETRYLDVAERALRAASSTLEDYPDACPTLLRALREFEQPRPQIVVRCPSQQIPAWRSALQRHLRSPERIPGGDPIDIFVMADAHADLPGVLASRQSPGTTGRAWLCVGTTCRQPVDSAAALADQLGA